LASRRLFTAVQSSRQQCSDPESYFSEHFRSVIRPPASSSRLRDSLKIATPPPQLSDICQAESVNSRESNPFHPAVYNSELKAGLLHHDLFTCYADHGAKNKKMLWDFTIDAVAGGLSGRGSTLTFVAYARTCSD